MSRPAQFLTVVAALVLWSVASVGAAEIEPAPPPASAAKPQHAPATFSYIGEGQIDLTVLLPPPPGPDSAQTRAELAEMEAVERTRTPAIVARVTADARENVFALAASIFGPSFTPERLPVTAAFFDRVETDEWHLTNVPKKYFARLRPPLIDSAIIPCIPLPKSFSYPSSHSTMAHLMGIVLALEVPERRDAIFARVEEYSWDRVIAGVHFPSDVEAGKVAGTAIAAVMLDDASFKEALGKSRAELRGLLGLR